MSDFIASLYISTNKPYFSTTAHPALIHHRTRWPHLWRPTRRPALKPPHSHANLSRTASPTRLTAGFEYIGPPRPADAIRLAVTRPSRPCSLS
jgi:hypothetical protein